MTEKIMYQITIQGQTKEYAPGTTYESIAADYQKEAETPIVLVKVNGKLTELFKTVHQDGVVEFVTMDQTPGIQSYHRSAVLLALKAFYDVAGHDRVKRIQVMFSVSKGLYIQPEGDFVLDEVFLPDRSLVWLCV